MKGIDNLSMFSMHPVEPTQPKNVQPTDPNLTMNLENLLNDSIAFTNIQGGLSFQNSVLSNMRSMRGDVSLGFGIDFDDKKIDLYDMRKINHNQASFDFFNIGTGLLNSGSQTSSKARNKRISEITIKKNSSVGNFNKKPEPKDFFDKDQACIPEIQEYEGSEQGLEQDIDIDFGLASLRFCPDPNENKTSKKEKKKNLQKHIIGRGSTKIAENPVLKMKTERERLKEKMKQSIHKNSKPNVPQIVGKLSNFKKKSLEHSSRSQSFASKDLKSQNESANGANPRLQKQIAKKLTKQPALKKNKLGISSKHRGSLKKIIEDSPNVLSKSNRFLKFK